MRLKEKALVTALTVATFVPGSVFAQTAPASATDLAASVDIDEAKTAMFTIYGLLIGVGVSLWIGRMVLSRFKARG